MEKNNDEILRLQSKNNRRSNLKAIILFLTLTNSVNVIANSNGINIFNKAKIEASSVTDQFDTNDLDTCFDKILIQYGVNPAQFDLKNANKSKYLSKFKYTKDENKKAIYIECESYNIKKDLEERGVNYLGEIRPTTNFWINLHEKEEIMSGFTETYYKEGDRVIISSNLDKIYNQIKAEFNNRKIDFNFPSVESIISPDEDKITSNDIRKTIHNNFNINVLEKKINKQTIKQENTYNVFIDISVEKNHQLNYIMKLFKGNKSKSLVLENSEKDSDQKQLISKIIDNILNYYITEFKAHYEKNDQSEKHYIAVNSKNIYDLIKSMKKIKKHNNIKSWKIISARNRYYAIEIKTNKGYGDNFIEKILESKKRFKRLYESNKVNQLNLSARNIEEQNIPTYSFK